MEKNTFGDSDKYKMLIFITEKINELERNEKEYISKFISDFNKLIKDIKIIYYENYVLKLIENDYLQRIENFNYDDKLKTYLKNYIKAKIYVCKKKYEKHF